MTCSVWLFLATCFLVVCFATQSFQESSDIPMFGGNLNNITVSVTRDASFTCVVENLSTYKVAWLRVDTQTILTIAGHVITKNHRILITHSDQRSWTLHIKDVREADQGWYMCQLNTDPMKSQTAFLQVVVPPDILDHPTSSDMVVRENGDVTLRCAASGSPPPSVTWRRENSRGISLGNGTFVASVEGSQLHIPIVTRQDMGAYLCIASNGVPPSVSKRILLIVHFPPNIYVAKQLVAAKKNHPTTLECHSEAYPRAINYWTKDRGEILTEGSKYEPHIEEVSYKLVMRLTIKNVTERDYGAYKCVSKNSLGDTEGNIKLYPFTASSVSGNQDRNKFSSKDIQVQYGGSRGNMLWDGDTNNYDSDGQYGSFAVENSAKRNGGHRFVVLLVLFKWQMS